MTSRLPSPVRSRWLRAGIVGAMLAALAAPAASMAAVVEPELPHVTGSVTAFGPAVLSPGVNLTTAVELSNVSVDQAELMSVRVVLTRAKLASREDIAEFLDSPANYSSRTVVEQPLPSGPAGQLTLTTLTAIPDDLGLRADTWGVYGVSVLVVGADEHQMIDAMVFTWAGAAVPNLPLSVVSTVAGSAAQVESTLTATGHPSVTYVVDPMAVGRVDGATATVSSHEAYRVPAGNLDLASLAHGQGQSVLQFALSRAAADVPPSLQELPWLAIAPLLDEPTLQLAHDYGAVATMIEPRFGESPPAAPSNRTGLSPAVVDLTLKGSGDTIALLVPDLALSTLIEQYRPQHPATTARLIAESALLAQQGDGTQPVLIAATSASTVDGSQPSPVLAALLDAPWITPTSLASVLSNTHRGAATIAGVEASDDDLSAVWVEAIATRLVKLEHLAATTDSPSAVIDAPSTAMLSAVSLEVRASHGERNGALQRLLDEVDQTLDSVSITTGSALNLVSTTGNVPVTIRNNLDVASTVTVLMTVNSPNIRITASPVVTIPPRSEVIALVPVTAVSSANVTVRVSLRNADHEVIGAPRNVDIRVRADWGNAVTAVFTVALVILLIAGLVRTIRRGRKDTRTGPGEVAALAEPEASEVAHE